MIHSIMYSYMSRLFTVRVNDMASSFLRSLFTRLIGGSFYCNITFLYVKNNQLNIVPKDYVSLSIVHVYFLHICHN